MESPYNSYIANGFIVHNSAEAVSMCVQCKCNSMQDIIAINAANRPGTKEMFPDYIYNKFHEDKKGLIHDELIEITKNANYVLLYQEHFLKIFELAGFSEEARDKARKSIGKKLPDVMKKLEGDFKEGLNKRGWDEQQITEMWDLMLKQANYSFNLGHKMCVTI